MSCYIIKIYSFVRPLTLSQMLVGPSVVESGQLVPGQVLRMDQSNVRIDAPVGEGNYGWVYRGHLTTPVGRRR